ncbi:MAG: cyclic nucleotide-binding domain-containing protein [Acidobacteriota bacterium]
MSLPDIARRSQLFAGLSEVEFQDVLSLSEPLRFAAGDVLWRQGDEGDGLYLVESGLVRIATQPGPIQRDIVDLGPGQVFGEMALLSDEPRIADALIAEDAVLHRFGKAAFTELIESHDPAAHRLLLGLARMLCVRLREVSAL